MCAICQNGPAVLAGVPAASLVIAHIRRALTGRHEPTTGATDEGAS
jgi:hypothetical protein